MKKFYNLGPNQGLHCSFSYLVIGILGIFHAYYLQYGYVQTIHAKLPQKQSGHAGSALFVYV